MKMHFLSKFRTKHFVLKRNSTTFAPENKKQGFRQFMSGFFLFCSY